FETNVSIDIIGHLAPLLPGPLFEVINQSKNLGWIFQTEDDHFAISDELPAPVKKKLSKINTPDHITTIVHQLQNCNPDLHSDPQTFIQLINKAGAAKEVVEMELELAAKFLQEDNQLQAWQLLHQAVDRMIGLLENDNYKKIYINATLELSNLSFILGKGLGQQSKYLHKAHEAAQNLGDLRSHAIINMHLGRLYYFSDRREDALVALSVGINGIEELSDEDMLDQCAVFLGLFYYIQGLFKKALPHLERAVKLYETQEKGQPTSPLAPILFGYSLLYLGEFHRAIGSLDCHWRMAKERQNHTMATTLRVILGTVLYLMKKEKEAEIHLKGAEKDAQDSNNELSLYLAKGVQTLKSLNSGRPVEAHEFLIQTMRTGRKAGFIRQFSSPWIMEMVYEFEKLGYEPIPDFTFTQIRERSIKENNVHLQGVAIRLEVQKKIAENRSKTSILKDLNESETYLEQSGDCIQLSKTIIERARYELAQDNTVEGRRNIQKAWTTLKEYADDFFPDDLKYLLNQEQQERFPPETPQESFDRYIELSESIFTINSQDEISSRAVLAINRFLGAERGGLFRFPANNLNKKPKLIASCNLTISDVEADDFESCRDFIKKAFKKNMPILERKDKNDLRQQKDATIKAMLFLPIELKGKVRAVLYHDNSYLNDCFDFMNTEMLNKMIGHFSRQTTRLWEFFQLQGKQNDLTIKKDLHEESESGKIFIHKSRAMNNLTKQLEKAAPSDSTILVSGETGVGKEVIAYQIHAMSQRHDKPF
ncbi:sigma 54-interacting transcriptional regulator, partial [bacterium]|nr:sigma 54-interacting transcriptional regulator [bacterium]